MLKHGFKSRWDHQHLRRSPHNPVTPACLDQIQVNALLLLLEQQQPAASIRDHFQRLVTEGVQAVGMETMEGIKNRIREGITQQDKTEPGSNGHGQS